MGTKCLLMALLLLSLAMAVVVCPADKMPTSIAISHQRIPTNLALGVTDNTIVINTVLTFTNTETGQKAPLAGKEILMEITLLDKFLVMNPDGTFVLSSTAPALPLNFTTTEDGSIEMTLYTNRLFGQITNPKKISYSIKATFTPNSTRDMFLGSYKSVNYVPGSFPIVSFATCMPLLIVFALLAGALFASGRNPLSFFDFSRVAFNAPTMKRKQAKGMTFAPPQVVQKLYGAALKVAMKGVFTGISKGTAAIGKGVMSLGRGLKTSAQKNADTKTATGGAKALGKGYGVIGLVALAGIFKGISKISGIAGGRVGKTKKTEEEILDASKKVEKLGVSKEEADKLAKGGFLRKGIQMEEVKLDGVPTGRYVVVNKADLVAATKRLYSFNETVSTEGVGSGLKGALAWAGQVFAQAWKQGLSGGMTGGFTIWSYSKQSVPTAAYSRIGEKSDADKTKEIKGIADSLGLDETTRSKYLVETKDKKGNTILTLTDEDSAWVWVEALTLWRVARSERNALISGSAMSAGWRRLWNRM